MTFEGLEPEIVKSSGGRGNSLVLFTPLRGRVHPHQGHKVSYAQAGLFDLACAMSVLL